MANDSVKIWTNGFKKSDSHPDFTAQNVEINGVECDVSVWLNQGKNGKPYLSLIAKPPYKEKEEAPSETPPEDRSNRTPEEADLPF